MGWTSPRTWVAGERPTAATMNLHIRDNLNALNGFARKTSTETVTSSATYQDDDHLFATLDTAGGRYMVDAYLRCSSAANAAGDIKFRFTFANGGSFLFMGFGPDIGLASGAVQTGSWAVTSGSGTDTSDLSFGLATTAVGIHLNALITPTFTDTLRLQWAQNASNANGSSIVAGSYMTVRQVQ